MNRATATVVVFGLALLAAIGTAEAQTPHTFLGRSVADVLRELHAAGERLIFTSVLVPDNLRVRAEPRATGRREIAQEILEPHGLTLKKGPGNTWLVVRATVQPSASPRPRDAPPPSRGDHPPPSSGQAEIRIEEEVQVTDRLGDLSRDPSVYRIEPRQILQTAGSLENLFQVLPMLPGVAATNDEEGKFSVRGGGPEHNVVLLDGVQVHSPQRSGDFGTSFVNPAVVTGVAFDASGLDARHGGRLGSVTVLETRNGVTDRRLAVSGSAGLTAGDVLAEGRLPGTQSGSWWAAARGTYYKFVSDRFRDGGTPGFIDVQFKVQGRPSPTTELSLVGLIGKEGMALRTPIQVDPSLIGIMPETIREEIDTDNRLAAFNVRWTPGPRLTSVTTVTAYGSANGYYDDLGRDYKPFDRDVRVADFGVRQRASVSWTPGHLLDVGVEARRVSTSWRMSGSGYSPHERSVGPDTWGGFLEYDGPIDSRLKKTVVGVWLQDRISLSGRVALEPGARVDWNSFTGEAALQPRVRVSKAWGRTVLWTGLAWQAQTPGHEMMQQGYSYYELAGPEASGLRNERSRQVVVGVARELGATTFRVEAYHRAFDRLLVQQQETPAERDQRLTLYVVPPDMPADSALVEYRPTVRPQSTGTGNSTGIEVLLQRTRGRLTGWVSYTLSKAERELYGRTVPFEFDRTHATALAVDFQLLSKVRLSATSQFASGFALTPLVPEPVFPEQQQIVPPPTPPYAAARGSDGALVLMNNPANPLRLSLLNSTRASAYARTDVRATFAIAAWLEVYGEIINLFGRENFHPTTDFRNGMEAHYQIAPNLPRLPTYGVRLRF